MQRARQEWSAGSRRTTTGLRATAALARTSRAASHHLKVARQGQRSRENAGQKRGSAAVQRPSHLLGRTGRDHVPTLAARPRPEFQDPVALRGDTHVVLDHNDGVPGLDQPTKLEHEPLDVGGMQPCAWLVEHVERVASLDALEFGRKLDPLRLPSDSSVAG